jgi:hypothetical protein
MAGWDGNGNWTRSYLWATDAANGTAISSSRMDTEWSNISSGFNNCLTRDGQGKPSAAINFNGQNLTNVAVFGATGNSTFGADLAITGTATIGVNALAQNFVVSAAGGAFGASGTNPATIICYGATGSPANTILFYTLNTERMRVASDGAVSIGGTLTVTGAVTFSSTIAAGGIISDPKGNVRKIPVNAQGSGYTLVLADADKTVTVTGSVTIPASIFAAGDFVNIYNNSGASVTLTQGGGLTLRLGGSATTGSRTLAQRGMASIYFQSSTEAVALNGGLT